MNGLKTSKILVVEDDPQMCESIRSLLSAQGYAVQVKTDFYDALNSLLYYRFELVLLDIQLGEQSGFVIMDYLLVKNLDTRVIVITGQPSENNAATAHKKGAIAYLKKPFDPEVLLISVKKALHGNSDDHQPQKIEKSHQKQQS